MGTEPPVILAVTPTVKALAGEDVVLECWVSGVPAPRIVWYKGEAGLGDCCSRPQGDVGSWLHWRCPRAWALTWGISPRAGEQEVAASPGGMQRGVLQLQAVREEDSGEYICEALSEAGASFDGIVLDVGSAPWFSEEPEDVLVEIGESVSLLCHVKGSPRPRIAWSRQDGKPVVGQHGPFDVSRRLEADELFIDSASLDDQAVYICEAQNEFGKIQAEVKLAVTGHEAPEIARGPPQLRVLGGQPVSLPCVVLAGKPFPVRRWLKHGQPVRFQAVAFLLDVAGWCGPSLHQDVSAIIQGPVSRSIPKMDLNGTLMIPLPYPGDAGTYFCTATNTAGSSSREVQLSVSTKPRISVNGSRELSGPITILAVAGQETILPCEVHGYPAPLVTWTQESQTVPLTSTRYSVLPSGSLRLAEPQVIDNGFYTCTATNAAGNASLGYSLEVQGTCPCRGQGTAYMASLVASPSKLIQLGPSDAGRPHSQRHPLPPWGPGPPLPQGTEGGCGVLHLQSSEQGRRGPQTLHPACSR
uniref:Ig-like domain-containing protein n=1 Tax=Apteryx owenii TaxID=8824 RepID=A0A8B9PLS2_APTOW